MAVLGIIQVDDGHRRFFDEVIPKQAREQDGADDGDQHGDLFIGHAHAGKEEGNFMFQGVHGLSPR